MGESSKIVQSANNVNATTNKYIHITYKNNSATNNQLRFQFRHSGDNFAAYVGTNETINTSSADFEVLTIDLTGQTEWTGLTQDFQLGIRDTDNGNKASAGDLEIDSIVFSSSATLSLEDTVFSNSISIYPNPASNFINITSRNTILKVQIFDITGKKVSDFKNFKSNTLDVSSLTSGIYLMKIADNNNNNSTKKIIIK